MFLLLLVHTIQNSPLFRMFTVQYLIKYNLNIKIIIQSKIYRKINILYSELFVVEICITGAQKLINFLFILYTFFG